MCKVDHYLKTNIMEWGNACFVIFINITVFYTKCASIKNSNKQSAVFSGKFALKENRW